MLHQYCVQEAKVPGFRVYQARVRVKYPGYASSMDVAIFAKSVAMARQLLMAQYGRDAVISNVIEIA